MLVVPMSGTILMSMPSRARKPLRCTVDVGNLRDVARRIGVEAEAQCHLLLRGEPCVRADAKSAAQTINGHGATRLPVHPGFRVAMHSSSLDCASPRRSIFFTHSWRGPPCTSRS